MPTPFVFRRRVAFHETDTAQMVHFSNYFRYMEEAEVEFLRSLGLSVTLEWEGEHFGFPRVSASCDFVRPVRFDDMLDIAVSVQRLGSKSVTYAFEFRRGAEIVARGQVTSVCCRVRPGLPIEALEIPEGLRSRLQ